MKFRKKPEVKYCNKCKTEKEINFWSKNKPTKDGLSTQCKTCMAENARNHYERNKDKVLGKIRMYNKNIGKYNAVKKRYGVSKVQYLQMIKDSGGKCAICGEEFKGKEPYLDHCHKNKIIRGLLCNSCNVGLARFRDDLLLLDKAKEYLRREGV